MLVSVSSLLEIVAKGLENRMLSLMLAAKLRDYFGAVQYATATPCRGLSDEFALRSSKSFANGQSVFVTVYFC